MDSKDVGRELKRLHREAFPQLYEEADYQENVIALIEPEKLEDCKSCRKYGENREACFWCVQCKAPLCTTCDSTIHELKLLEEHERLELRGLEICNQHLSPMDRYCCSCEEKTCHECGLTLHFGHKGHTAKEHETECLPVIFQKKKDQVAAELQNIQETIKAINKELVDKKEQLQNTESRLEMTRFCSTSLETLLDKMTSGPAQLSVKSLSKFNDQTASINKMVELWKKEVFDKQKAKKSVHSFAVKCITNHIREFRAWNGIHDGDYVFAGKGEDHIPIIVGRIYEKRDLKEVGRTYTEGITLILGLMCVEDGIFLLVGKTTNRFHALMVIEIDEKGRPRVETIEGDPLAFSFDAPVRVMTFGRTVFLYMPYIGEENKVLAGVLAKSKGKWCFLPHPLNETSLPNNARYLNAGKFVLTKRQGRFLVSKNPNPKEDQIISSISIESEFDFINQTYNNLFWIGFSKDFIYYSKVYELTSEGFLVFLRSFCCGPADCGEERGFPRSSPRLGRIGTQQSYMIVSEYQE